MNQKLRMLALGAGGVALLVALAFYMRGPAPEDLPLPAPHAPSSSVTQHSPPQEEEAKGGFAFAYAGQDENADDEIGCGFENVCLLGRFAPDLAVRVLLPTGDTCTGRTGDAYHFAGDMSERDMTALSSFDGCMTSDVGPDGAIAVVETPALLDADFKWLPVSESETPLQGPLKDADARALIEEYSKATKLKGAPLVSEVTIDKLTLITVREQPSTGGRVGSGPLFLPQGGKLLHPFGKDSLCQTISGAFRLNTSTFVVVETGACETDSGGRMILEWNGKDWKEVAYSAW